MNFRIADTFTRSLERLQGQEQKAVKITAMDLQFDPSSPGLKFHRVDRSKDSNFWSLRVNRDLRIIVHKTEADILLCYVGHHDEAYAWAERRRIERHPRTGAAQLVELREVVEAVAPTQPAASTVISGWSDARFPFGNLSDDELLDHGVPHDWIEAVRMASEDDLFALAEHLPQEAAEALLDIAVGETPAPVAANFVQADMFDHPDAARRFRILENVEELERAFDAPWERWTLFLHPAQRRHATADYNGPARVAGSAGTGKTVVALHRAVHLARRSPDANVLLATFSRPLSRLLSLKLARLAGEEAARIHVAALPDLAQAQYQELIGDARIAGDARIRSLIAESSAALEGLSARFLWTEWRDVVDPWQVRDESAYMSVPRLGRRTRLGARQRAAAWRVFASVRAGLGEEDLLTRADMFALLTERLAAGEGRRWNAAVIDEAQDLGVAELRWLAALAGGRSNGLFFAGDLGQRIFRAPFSWKSLGIDVRGRSHTLKVNYRTSHQIRRQADRLLPEELSDIDGNAERRKGTVSVFDGPSPEIRLFEYEASEIADVGAWLSGLVETGLTPEECSVFVRTAAALPRAHAAIAAAGFDFANPGDDPESSSGRIIAGTMHDAKGLEFRAVAVMACDDEVLPLQARIEDVADESDLEEVYATERHLLYVACTRAREHLRVSGVAPGSEFLDDLEG